MKGILTKTDKADIKGIIVDAIKGLDIPNRKEVKEMVVTAIKEQDIPNRKEVKEMIDSSVNGSFDSLARITSRGFDYVMERMDGIGKELGEFKNEMYFFRDRTDQALFDLHSDMTDVKGRLTGVESRLTDVETKVDNMGSMWHDHDMRIIQLEEAKI